MGQFLGRLSREQPADKPTAQQLKPGLFIIRTAGKRCQQIGERALSTRSVTSRSLGANTGWGESAVVKNDPLQYPQLFENSGPGNCAKVHKNADAQKSVHKLTRPWPPGQEKNTKMGVS